MEFICLLTVAFGVLVRLDLSHGMLMVYILYSMTKTEMIIEENKVLKLISPFPALWSRILK